MQRILAHLLNDSAAEEMADFLVAGPRYLHLLGTTARGRRFLASRRKALELPLVGNFSRVTPQLKRRYGADSDACRQALAQLAAELRATRNHSLLLHDFAGENRNRDYFSDPLFYP